jgi:hypothetical protein
MRINVYHEEITTEAVFVEKHVPETGKTYYGVRMFMKSAPELHHEPNDDDRSAITFWWGTKRAAIRHLELITESLLNDIGGG